MARYTGSKAKLSRRVNRNLFLKGARSYSAKDDFSKKPYRPGQHGKGRPPKVTEYGKQLQEKQALKYTYGLLEKQMSNLFKKAFRQTGDTGKIALTNLERRLDNVIYKGNLANSRAQARQLVTHGHFFVNGKKVNIPSFQVSTGDVVIINPVKEKAAFWQIFQLEVPSDVPTWLDATKNREIKVINLPLETDLPSDVKIAAIVEWYARRTA